MFRAIRKSISVFYQLLYSEVFCCSNPQSTVKIKMPGLPLAKVSIVQEGHLSVPSSEKPANTAYAGIIAPVLPPSFPDVAA